MRTPTAGRYVCVKPTTPGNNAGKPKINLTVFSVIPRPPPPFPRSPQWDDPPHACVHVVSPDLDVPEASRDVHTPPIPPGCLLTQRKNGRGPGHLDTLRYHGNTPPTPLPPLSLPNEGEGGVFTMFGGHSRTPCPPSLHTLPCCWGRQAPLTCSSSLPCLCQKNCASCSRCQQTCPVFPASWAGMSRCVLGEEGVSCE